jgi:hypothetical protein
MTPEILVEISLPRSGAVPADQIVAAYRASRFGQIALVLNGVSAGAVNKVLDPVVPTLPLDIPGLVYIDITDSARLGRLLCGARMLVASTPWLRTAAALAGLEVSRSLAPDAAESWHTGKEVGLRLVISPPASKPLAPRLSRKPHRTRVLAGAARVGGLE